MELSTLALFGFLFSLLLSTFWISLVNNGGWFSTFVNWKTQLKFHGADIILLPIYQEDDDDD